MKFSEAFPNRYLRGVDLEDGQKITAVISHVEMRVIGRDAKDEKPVLLFNNGCSPVVLNTSNWNRLAEMFGEDSRDWAGQRVDLVPYNGEMVEDGKVKPFRGIRMDPLDPAPDGDRAAAIEAARKAEAEAKEAAKATAKQRHKPGLAGAKDPDLDDEIPF